jgi:hypothetical protein
MKNLVENAREKRSLGRPRRKWQDSIEIYLTASFTFPFRQTCQLENQGVLAGQGM